MRKKPKEIKSQRAAMVHDHQRGEIKDNALKALVTSPLFQTRVEKAKKGKGSFRRKAKHQGQEPYLLVA